MTKTICRYLFIDILTLKVVVALAFKPGLDIPFNSPAPLQDSSDCGSSTAAVSTSSCDEYKKSRLEI